jgi:hypothetical protein
MYMASGDFERKLIVARNLEMNTMTRAAAVDSVFEYGSIYFAISKE